MEALALHDFVPEDPNTELAFRRNDKLIILNYGASVEWYDAVKGNQQGLVPGNYIHIEKPNWFWGRLTRAQAEQILHGTTVDGAFLIRQSESAPTNFSLSVKCSESASPIQHYRISREYHNRYYIWKETFASLNELVDYYRKVSVSQGSHVLLRDIEFFVVEALYDFEPADDAEGELELEIRKGDLITVTDASDENWWKGYVGGREGYFPRTYVRKNINLVDI